MFTEKNVLVKKMFANEVNMRLSQRYWVEKIVHGVGAHWLSGKGAVSGTAISKECRPENLLEHGRAHHYWFLRKRWNC